MGWAGAAWHLHPTCWAFVRCMWGRRHISFRRGCRRLCLIYRMFHALFSRAKGAFQDCRLTVDSLRIGGTLMAKPTFHTPTDKQVEVDVDTFQDAPRSINLKPDVDEDISVRDQDVDTTSVLVVNRFGKLVLDEETGTVADYLVATVQKLLGGGAIVSKGLDGAVKELQKIVSPIVFPLNLRLQVTQTFELRRKSPGNGDTPLHLRVTADAAVTGDASPGVPWICEIELQPVGGPQAFAHVNSVTYRDAGSALQATTGTVMQPDDITRITAVITLRATLPPFGDFWNGITDKLRGLLRAGGFLDSNDNFQLPGSTPPGPNTPGAFKTFEDILTKFSDLATTTIAGFIRNELCSIKIKNFGVTASVVDVPTRMAAQAAAGGSRAARQTSLDRYDAATRPPQPVPQTTPAAPVPATPKLSDGKQQTMLPEIQKEVSIRILAPGTDLVLAGPELPRIVDLRPLPAPKASIAETLLSPEGNSELAIVSNGPPVELG